VNLHRLLRWAKNRKTPLWDQASSPPRGPVRFHSDLRTASQIMDISGHQSQHELGVPGTQTGTAA
jgi:hypothetical protein